jgi:hypothetical protein
MINRLPVPVALPSTAGSLETYIQIANRFPLLTEAEEMRLAPLRTRTTWTPPASWCCRTCAWWYRSPADTWGMDCRTPT